MVALRLLTANPQRYDRLSSILESDSELSVVWCATTVDALHAYPDADADVILVDLAHPRTSEARFWAELHILWPMASLMAIIEAPFDKAKIAAALHAGAYYMVDWTDPASRVGKVARAASLRQGYVPLGNALNEILTYFRHSSVGCPSLHFGEVRLDLSRRVLVKGTSEIHLSVLEHRLLVYLAENTGRVVPTDELAQAVWHEPPEGLIATYQLKSIIKRLRSKLEPDPSQPRYLLNRRGHGYFIPTEALH